MAIENLGTQKTDSSQGLSFNFYASVSSICLLLQNFYIQYLRAPDGDLIFFRGDDLPGTLISRYSPIIGRHYFGDLLDGHSNFGLRGSYFGLSYVFFWLTKDFSYRLVFVLFVVIGIVVCGLSINRWLGIVPDDQKSMVYALHFSYPFVFAADRGQMHLLIGYLFALGLSFVVKTQGDEKVLARGQLALGVAFSMKIFPSIVFAFFPKFWSLQRWKILISSFIGILLVSSFLSPVKFKIFTTVTAKDELYNSLDYYRLTMPFNTSLKALIFNFQSLNSGLFENIFDFLFHNYFMVYLIYAALAFVFMQGKNIRSHERLLAGAIISISIAPIAAVYCQTIVAACALWSLTCNQFVSNLRRRFYALVVLISVVPFNIPIKRNAADLWRFQSTIVPLVQHAYVVTMCVVATIGFLSSRRNSHGVKKLLTF